MKKLTDAEIRAEVLKLAKRIRGRTPRPRRVRPITGEWLYDAHHRAQGAARVAPEFEPTWDEKSDEIQARWNRLAAMVRRKVRSK